ncbi:hypothetical protein C8046_03540 [Serinibacter arcticus]|uniref:HTH tetR-type domain-containing protein n=1 Tax=Serinibacter arcticus TaxID=1655435 RepID=A0A2U1ZZB9_9MICO|nr:hypothetical protein C8046_03540 [Serinibacter arcticus]
MLSMVLTTILLMSLSLDRTARRAAPENITDRNGPVYSWGVSTPSPRGRHREAAENDVRIFEAAKAVFTDDPDAPISAVGAAAGVGKSALYRRYPSKQELLEAVAQDLTEQYVSVIERSHEELDRDVDPRTVLETFLADTAATGTHATSVAIAGRFEPSPGTGSGPRRVGQRVTAWSHVCTRPARCARRSTGSTSTSSSRRSAGSALRRWRGPSSSATATPLSSPPGSPHTRPPCPERRPGRRTSARSTLADRAGATPPDDQRLVLTTPVPPGSIVPHRANRPPERGRAQCSTSRPTPYTTRFPAHVLLESGPGRKRPDTPLTPPGTCAPGEGTHAISHPQSHRRRHRGDARRQPPGGRVGARRRRPERAPRRRCGRRGRSRSGPAPEPRGDGVEVPRPGPGPRR